jgi:hypothetical protein
VRFASEPGYVLIKSPEPQHLRILERATNPLVKVVDKDVKEMYWEEVNINEVTEEAMKFEKLLGEDLKHFIDAESDGDLKSMLRRSVGWQTDERNQEIEVDYLMQYLDHKDKDNRLCVSLFWNAIFMAVYVVTALQHEDFSSSALLQREVHGMLTGTSYEGVDKSPTFSGHKIFQDIDTIEDMYNYLEQALFPLFLPENPGASFTEDTRVLRYNRLIGGIQMQQKRRNVKPCNEAWPNLGPFYDNPDTGTEQQPLTDGFDCYRDNYLSDMSDDCFGPLKYNVRQPGERYSLPSGFCADKSLEGYLDEASSGGRRMEQKHEKDGSSSWAGSNPYEAFQRQETRSSQMRHILSHSSRWWAKAAPLDTSEKFEGDFMRKIKARLARKQFKARSTKQRLQTQRWGRSKQKENEKPERSADARPRRMRVARRRKSTKTPVSLAWYPGLKFHQDALAYSVLINSGAGLSEALVRLNWLKQNKWLDLQSQWMGVRLFMLNPEMSMYNHASINMYFGPGGEVVRWLRPTPSRQSRTRVSSWTSSCLHSSSVLGSSSGPRSFWRCAGGPSCTS